MKHRFNVPVWSLLILLLTFGVTSLALGQNTIKVTFNLNTSTNLDTLNENHFVEIRGALNWKTGAILPGGKTIDWNSSSDLEMTNVGGDYWTITFEMEPDDTLYYKFWTGFDPDNGTHPNGGWEGPFNQAINADTRVFISGNTDTVVALQFYHPDIGGQKVDQYWRPFETKQDSVAIFFRVNMGGVTESERFNPDVNGPVGVRGEPSTSNGALDWGSTKVILTRETDSVNGGSFWSGVVYIHKDSLKVGDVQNYKFFIENDTDNGWENSVPNRTFTYTATLVTSGGDTTLHWRYFDDLKPTGKQPVESTVTFRVNLEALEKVGLFDRGAGDKVAVIGAKGWNRPDDLIMMNFIPALQEWAVSEPFREIPGSMIPYKYFIIWDSSRVDTNSSNYIAGLDINDGWEEPGVTGGGNRVFEYQNAPQQTPPGDLGKDLQFYDSVPVQGVIETPITVTFNVDMRPAADAATNPKTLFRPGQDSVYVQFDGSLFALTQGMPKGGENARILLTDDDGDGIYSGAMQLNVPTLYMVSYIIAYSTDTGFETNGGGFDKGRRYYQYIRPTRVNSDGTIEWPSEYSFPTVVWKEKDLDVEDPPDLFTPTGIADERAGLPKSFRLEQNFPNPFNPETEIRYELPVASHVNISVYNLMGQLVKTLVDARQDQGVYSIKWNGQNEHGRTVATGVYLLKMRAGDFLQVRKMAFVR
ncbi:MAG: FlgD immunoglobulin-like domain containing protein [candidate division KSB1 bacterium]|nr:FlgD immunoglobulin-like domain containing protein [candidate division KSB1 bacterium]